jgi:actin related protein 2/3 complex subunit 4
MEEVDKEISETRLSLNARARIVAESYLATVSDLCFCYVDICAQS